MTRTKMYDQTTGRELNEDGTPKRKRRVFLWVFLAIQVVFLIWVIAGASSGAGSSPACDDMVGEALRQCEEAGDAGTAIGVSLVVIVWMAVDVIVGGTYLVYRLFRRH